MMRERRLILPPSSSWLRRTLSSNAVSCSLKLLNCSARSTPLDDDFCRRKRLDSIVRSPRSPSTARAAPGRWLVAHLSKSVPRMTVDRDVLLTHPPSPVFLTGTPLSVKVEPEIKSLSPAASTAPPGPIAKHRWNVESATSSVPPQDDMAPPPPAASTVVKLEPDTVAIASTAAMAPPKAASSIASFANGAGNPSSHRVTASRSPTPPPALTSLNAQPETSSVPPATATAPPAPAARVPLKTECTRRTDAL
mmetsp:Transcript_20460/g.61002  ORF Transcript_20460/g.61002 Transcript_20460/m.61002 type:complete len:251 (+) Transcript_20460:571-1323(+)